MDLINFSSHYLFIHFIQFGSINKSFNQL